MLGIVLLGAVYGLAGIPLPDGMTDLEFAAQSWLTDTLGAIPMWALALVVAAAALGYGLLRDARSRRRGDAEGGSGPGDVGGTADEPVGSVDGGR